MIHPQNNNEKKVKIPIINDSIISCCFGASLIGTGNALTDLSHTFSDYPRGEWHSKIMPIVTANKNNYIYLKSLLLQIKDSRFCYTVYNSQADGIRDNNRNNHIYVEVTRNYSYVQKSNRNTPTTESQNSPFLSDMFSSNDNINDNSGLYDNNTISGHHRRRYQGDVSDSKRYKAATKLQALARGNSYRKKKTKKR